MGSEGDRISGRCLCGAVSFSCMTAKREIDVCHCGMCRRWSGGLFMALAHDGVVAFEGKENIGVYKSSEWGERAFCKICGTSLYWHHIGSDHYALSAAALDNQAQLRLTEQIFIDEKPAFYDLANDTPKLTGAEVMAAFNVQAASEGET